MRELEVFDNGHAILSPSGWGMWSKCTGAMVGLNRSRKKGTDSMASVEGTLAHFLLELSLINWIHPSNIATQDQTDAVVADIDNWCEKICNNTNNTAEVIAFAVECHQQGSACAFPEDMRIEVGKCFERLDVYKQNGWTILPEMKVTLKATLGHKHCDGTSDVIMYKGTRFKVADLKYGKGIEVSPDHSGQLQLYGLGALATLAESGQITYVTDVELVIMQPRIGNGVWKPWKTSMPAMIAFGEDAKMKSEAALKVLCGDDSAIHFEPTTGSCQWCHKKMNCKPRLDFALAEAKAMFAAALKTEGDLERDFDNVTNEMLANVLDRVPFIVSFANDMIAEAERRARDGQIIPRRKLVKGRSSRKWYQEYEDKLTSIMSCYGIDESDCVTIKVKSPAQMDKLKLTKEQKKVVKSLTAVSYGKESLVSISDARPEVVKNVKSTFENFLNNENKGENNE